MVRIIFLIMTIILSTYIETHSFCPQGANGFGQIIPPNSVLVFEVELVNIIPGSKDEL